MGLWNWLVRPSEAEAPPRKALQIDRCGTEFPKLWSSFVTHFTDVGFHGGHVATPEQAGVAGPLPTKLPAAERLIAIGDLHGDLDKTRRAFRAAGLTDASDKWIGGKTVAVQVGDVLDRGDAEIRILYFLESVQAQARASGGALHLINGNHETMNVMGNHRYATSGATREIVRWMQWQQLAASLLTNCNCAATQQQASQPPASLRTAETEGMWGASHFVRTFALMPGSTITNRFFANHSTILQVGSNVFVHGGVLPHHVEYGIERINQETRDWMRAQTAAGSPDTSSPASPASPTAPASPLKAPEFLKTSSAVVWARTYSAEDESRCDCDKLGQVLQALPGASRMIMGHTIQGSINSVCDGKALRVDVGMSQGCGDGQVEVLEILQDGAKVRRLREGAPPEDITHKVTSSSGRGVSPTSPPTAATPWGRVVLPSPAAL